MLTGGNYYKKKKKNIERHYPGWDRIGRVQTWSAVNESKHMISINVSTKGHWIKNWEKSSSWVGIKPSWQKSRVVPWKESPCLLSEANQGFPKSRVHVHPPPHISNVSLYRYALDVYSPEAVIESNPFYFLRRRRWNVLILFGLHAHEILRRMLVSPWDIRYLRVIIIIIFFLCYRSLEADAPQHFFL